ncbi:MAG: ABC transporter ATP-binding protein/permease [Anaerolineales bacterium]|jgi:ATP-binding cassette subfamily B protein|nr:ABC transporter ATP-binding protein/permease [Anaerolineales bacterium]
MLRLLKYLKPYTLWVLLSIVLLFVQANTDLALPDYMSDIVNVGIQQGGVESAVPQAIRQSALENRFLFMSQAEQEAVLATYTLVGKDSPAYSQLIETYPALAEESVYVLTTVDDTVRSRLETILARPLLVGTFLEQIAADPARAAVLGQQLGFDLSRLPAGSDVYALLNRLPTAQLAQMNAAIDQQLGTMNESLMAQAAVETVKTEYQALGLDTARLQSRYIFRTGLLMLLVTVISGLSAIGVGLISARVAAGMARDIRHDLFERVESFSGAEFDRFSTASLITRTTNDITQVQMVVIMVLRTVFYAPIIGVGGIIRALSKTTSMWWIIALAVVILLGLILTVFSIALPKFKSIQNLIDRLNLVTRENLTGMMVIRAFNNQSFEEKRFDQANQNLTGTLLFINRVMVVMMPVMMLVMNGTMLLIIWVGAHEVAQSQMQVGDMMAFMQYAMQIVFAFLMLSMMFIILPRAAVSGERIADVLGTHPSILDPAQPRQFPEPFRGEIEFRKVNFRYPGAEEDVLHDISFIALPGQTTAFLGTTGSGKSTIVSLIPRFYDVADGEVYVDGIDIRTVSQHDLRDKIGYVPQKSSLFSGTIESNLRYADEDASEDALRQATDIAQASEFIFAREEGLQAEIAQGGANVSGGQKQRLAIARALVKQPPIYIFDDSFSALDYKTDSALRKALKEKTGRSTLLVVTQRIATIKNAEQIIVLDEGRIVGKGTHRALMQDCEVYREIALSQLSKEELA